MRFLVDENIGRSIVEYLRVHKHDVKWIREIKPGMSDRDIIAFALKEKRIIVTYDQDFGELVFLEKEKHHGIILLRLDIDTISHHLRALKNFFERHNSKEIVGKFHSIDNKYL